MKKYLTMMVALAVTLFSINSFAWDPPATPAPASWISDTSGVLSTSAHARLDAKLKQINQSSANEIAALVVPTLDGQSIEDVTNATFKAWGIGKKGLDNGILVVLAMKEHKSRIETGKGVEGDLPDLKTQDILVQARPYLRKGDVEGALGFIFDSSASAIANHKADATGSRPSCDVSGGVGAGSNSSLIFILVTTAGLGLLFWYLSASTRRRHEREQREAHDRLTASFQAQRVERERQRKAEEARLQHLQAANQPAPVVAPLTAQLKRVTHTPRPITRDAEPVESVVEPTRHVAPVVAAAAVAATATIAAAELERQRHHAEEARRKRERDEEESRRRRREQDEEDRRRRDREEDDRRSSSSSSSSSDWSSGGSSGGFGGGDSGGGGSSGDW